MVTVKNFNEHIEKSLMRVGQEAQKNLEKEEFKNLPEKEVVKQTIQSIASEVSAPTFSQQSATSQNEPQNSFLPAYLADEKDQNAKNKVRELVDIAFESGLEKALKEAKKQPPFVEDAFHDALTDKLLPELKKRGFLK